MTWFIIEFVVVCALVSGFMATHSLATAIVSASPAIAAIIWLRSLPVEGAMLWLVGGVPLLASMLGLLLGQYGLHRAKMREPVAAQLEPDRPTASDVMIGGDGERSTDVRGSMPGRAAAMVVGARRWGIWTWRGKAPMSAAITGGSGVEH